jgi:hypothetical protein
MCRPAYIELENVRTTEVLSGANGTQATIAVVIEPSGQPPSKPKLKHAASLLMLGRVTSATAGYARRAGANCAADEGLSVRL